VCEKNKNALFFSSFFNNIVIQSIFESFIQIEKVVKDIHGPALTLILEKLKPYGDFQGKFSFFFANHVELLLLVFFPLPSQFLSFRVI